MLAWTSYFQLQIVSRVVKNRIESIVLSTRPDVMAFSLLPQPLWTSKNFPYISLSFSGICNTVATWDCTATDGGEVMVENRTHRFLRYWFPVLFYCVIIFVQSSYPTVKKTYDLPHIDKLFHLVGYAILGILFFRGFKNSRFSNNFALIRTASILLTGMYGATDELHQHYVPHRTADIWDVFSDLLGGFLGVYIYQALLEKYPIIARI